MLLCSESSCFLPCGRRRTRHRLATTIVHLAGRQRNARVRMTAITRRQFLKVSGATLAGSSLALMGFSPHPRSPKSASTNFAHHRNPQYLSVLLGRLRHPDVRPRRQRQERQGQHHPHRRRSRSSGQSRHAVPEGRGPDRLHSQPEPPAAIPSIARPGPTSGSASRGTTRSTASPS